MKPVSFKYLKPAELEETLDILAEYGEDAKILAGGQSLMPLLNMRLARPAVLVDINGLEELDYIRGKDSGVAIGALARQRQLHDNPLVIARVPILGAAIEWISHPQIQNRGTIVGSIAHGDPAGELPAAALAAEAELTVRSKAGERIVRAADLYHGYYMTAVEPDELVTEVRFPGMPKNTGWSVQEVSRRHGDFALAGVAALISQQNGIISNARLAAYGVAGAAIRMTAAEKSLSGETPSEDLFTRVAHLLGDELTPDDDIHASAVYRQALATEMTRRVLEEALERTAMART